MFFLYLKNTIFYLGIKRELDQELLDRIKWHIKEVDLNEGIKNECKLNETLSQYWKRTEGYVLLF